MPPEPPLVELARPLEEPLADPDPLPDTAPPEPPPLLPPVPLPPVPLDDDPLDEAPAPRPPPMSSPANVLAPQPSPSSNAAEAKHTRLVMTPSSATRPADARSAQSMQGHPGRATAQLACRRGGPPVRPADAFRNQPFHMPGTETIAADGDMPAPRRAAGTRDGPTNVPPRRSIALVDQVVEGYEPRRFVPHSSSSTNQRPAHARRTGPSLGIDLGARTKRERRRLAPSTEPRGAGHASEALGAGSGLARSHARDTSCFAKAK